MVLGIVKAFPKYWYCWWPPKVLGLGIGKVFTDILGVGILLKKYGFAQVHARNIWSGLEKSPFSAIIRNSLHFRPNWQESIFRVISQGFQILYELKNHGNHREGFSPYNCRHSIEFIYDLMIILATKQGTSYMIVLEAYVLQYFRVTNMTYFA